MQSRTVVHPSECEIRHSIRVRIAVHIRRCRRTHVFGLKSVATPTLVFVSTVGIIFFVVAPQVAIYGLFVFGLEVALWRINDFCGARLHTG
jgi:hypothetical protein